MSGGVIYGTKQIESVFYNLTSIAWVKGRAEATTNSGQHERVAELTARCRLYEHSFGYLYTYSKHLQLSFRTEKIARFFRMKGSKSSHFSVA